MTKYSRILNYDNLEAFYQTRKKKMRIKINNLFLIFG